jgi:hypothetical protein
VSIAAFSPLFHPSSEHVETLHLKTGSIDGTGVGR